MTWLFVVIHTEFKIKKLEKLEFLILANGWFFGYGATAAIFDN
jgi:hypothetical protein